MSTIENLRNYALSSNIQVTTNLLDEKTLYMIQAVNLPGITTPTVDVDTKFGALPLQADTEQYSILALSIMIDENLDIYKNLINIAQQYKEPGNTIMHRGPEKRLYLSIYNNSDIELFTIEFYNVVLDSIGDLSYSFNSPNSELSISVGIKYSHFVII